MTTKRTGPSVFSVLQDPLPTITNFCLRSLGTGGGPRGTCAGRCEVDVATQGHSTGHAMSSVGQVSQNEAGGWGGSWRKELNFYFYKVHTWNKVARYLLNLGFQVQE